MFIKCLQPSSAWHQAFRFHLLSIWNLFIARTFLTFLMSEHTIPMCRMTSYMPSCVSFCSRAKDWGFSLPRSPYRANLGLNLELSFKAVNTNTSLQPSSLPQWYTAITRKKTCWQRKISEKQFDGCHSPYVAAGLRPVRVTLWMNIFLFSTPESTNRVDSPLVLISKSPPPRSPYSTLLSVLSKVVHVTNIEPGAPVKKVTLSQRTEFRGMLTTDGSETVFR